MGVRTVLAFALLATATLLTLQAAWVMAFEVADDQRQYLTFFWIKEVQGWLAPGVLVVAAAVLAALGVRLDAARGTARDRASA